MATFFKVLNKIKVGIKPAAKLKHIAVSERNYVALKRLGTAGDSFDDVVTENDRGPLRGRRLLC